MACLTLGCFCSETCVVCVPAEMLRHSLHCRKAAMQSQISTSDMVASVKQSSRFLQNICLSNLHPSEQSNNKLSFSIPNYRFALLTNCHVTAAACISHICPGSPRLPLHCYERHSEEIFIILHVLGWRKVKGPEEGRPSCSVSRVCWQKLFFKMTNPSEYRLQNS